MLGNAELLVARFFSRGRGAHRFFIFLRLGAGTAAFATVIGLVVSASLELHGNTRKETMCVLAPTLGADHHTFFLFQVKDPKSKSAGLTFVSMKRHDSPYAHSIRESVYNLWHSIVRLPKVYPPWFPIAKARRRLLLEGRLLGLHQFKTLG